MLWLTSTWLKPLLDFIDLERTEHCLFQCLFALSCRTGCREPACPSRAATMSWTAFLLAYLLGGITFIPIVIVTVLCHAYLTFPVRPDDAQAPVDSTIEDDIVQPGDDLAALRAAQKDGSKDSKDSKDSKSRVPSHVDSDVAAGYFAVCREYTPMGINAKPIERSTPLGSTTVAAPSPSVYQSMYRSLFERKQNHGPLDSQNNSQRPKKAGNVFYVVLR